MDKEIVDMYISGYSTVKIGNLYNMPYSTVRNILIKNGIKLRSNSLNSKRYSFNEDYFSHIDNEHKAYWLGFMYADGYITKNKFGVSLKDSDSAHLEKFREDLQSNHPIHLYKNDNEWSKNYYCRLLITSEKCVEDLINNGVFRNKTHILKPPLNVSDKFIPSFIRGYFDGDGGIILNGNSYYATFIGTPEFIQWISESIYTYIGVSPKKLEKRHDYDTVISSKYFGKDCYRLISFLYDNSTIFLDRKYERYIKAIKKFSLLYQK